MAESAIPERPTTPADVLRGRCALLLWDLQNGLAGQAPAVAELSEVWHRLRDSARDNGIPIMRSRHGAPRAELMSAPERWQVTRRTHGETRPEHFMKPGGHDTAFLDGFEPGPDEIVIDKTTPSIFHNTVADHHLRAAGVETLVLAGVASDIGIDFTARHALALGYFPVVVEDGVDSYTSAAHEHAMAILRSFTFVVSSAELISLWGDRGEGGQRDSS